MPASPAAEILVVRDARKSYGPRRALDGVSFDLRPGEMLALLGPNGAGKTTLIRALCGRLRLDAGEIRLHGASIREGRDHSAFGLVPQEIALYGDLTVRENLEIFGRLHGVPASQLAGRIETALHWTSLADRAGEFVRTLSGGMKRRLNVACAILHRPGVILLDEPTVGVDPQSRERIFEMLVELRRDGAAILLTTHQLEDAESHGDRIAILDDGRVIAVGTLPELIAATTGAAPRAVVRVDRPADLAALGFMPTRDPRVWTAALADPAADVPRLLAPLRQAGLGVEDLTIRRPSLQAVFLHATGRELRE